MRHGYLMEERKEQMLRRFRWHFEAFVDGIARSIDVAGALHADPRQHQGLRNVNVADVLRADANRVGRDLRRVVDMHPAR